MSTPTLSRAPEVREEPRLLVEERRDLRSVRSTDVLAVIGAAISATCLTALLFDLGPYSGTIGFLATAYALFLVLYGTLVSLDEGPLVVKDRLVAALAHTAALVVLSALVGILVYIGWQGHSALMHRNFFTQDMTTTPPLSPLTSGGIGHAIVGTAEQISIALVLTVPLGISAAVYITQTRTKLSMFLRTLTEAMTALPSIVAGLFVYAAYILAFGLRFSGHAAALALSVEMLPIIIRTAVVVLRLVPSTLLEAAYALGAPQWQAVRYVVLPTARSGLATAVILGMARGIGETSPVLITAGFTTAYNWDPLQEPQVSLPLFVFKMAHSPDPNMVARAFGAAAVLLALVLVLFVIARLLGGRGPGHQSVRQRRRAATRSVRDDRRITTLLTLRAEGHTPTDGDAGLSVVFEKH
ncbi:phosphate ABC transporter membrane protein 2 (PhoT family) [Motilibacter rhizosphaerae]|uniref:Phosphate transport system permease protein PstA n=1 Tax=Motilibacter rhizosphaerae TaxID=598652 RepID=A0A4Q7NXT2_9ACTN|nr:phosphate ABC transporter permease PstA [Motilibacter rhizosphaerae]RZS91202.1 phosphate ABC transporter membrane protein 2 (PhoT family) [Motilibacter rhizosphaerae]